MKPTPSILAKIEEILETVYMNGVKSAEHGIYIPLPNPKAIHTIQALLIEARVEEAELLAKAFPTFDWLQIYTQDRLEALRKGSE